MSKASDLQRQDLRAQIKRRGRRKYAVWTGYASKGKLQFALDGTPNTLHLIWMEADPDIVSYTIPTDRIIGQGAEGPAASVPDAICRMRSGKFEMREVKTDQEAAALRKNNTDQILAQTSSAQTYGMEWRLITLSEIERNRILIENWKRGLAYLWSTASFDLRPFEAEVMLLTRQGAVPIEALLRAYPNRNQALLIAAMFSLAQRGEIKTDLAERPLSRETMLRMGES